MGKWLFGGITSALLSTGAWMLGLVPWWGWVLLGLIPLSLVLSFLVRVKQLAGWPGVLGVLLVITHSVVFVLAYMMGRQAEVVNSTTSPSAPWKPSAPDARRIPTLPDLFGPPSQRRRYDIDTNTWIPANG